jgi:hypothetical protein
VLILKRGRQEEGSESVMFFDLLLVFSLRCRKRRRIASLTCDILSLDPVHPVGDHISEAELSAADSPPRLG